MLEGNDPFLKEGQERNNPPGLRKKNKKDMGRDHKSCLRQAVMRGGGDFKQALEDPQTVRKGAGRVENRYSTTRKRRTPIKRNRGAPSTGKKDAFSEVMCHHGERKKRVRKYCRDEEMPRNES